MSNQPQSRPKMARRRGFGVQTEAVVGVRVGLGLGLGLGLMLMLMLKNEATAIMFSSVR